MKYMALFVSTFTYITRRYNCNGLLLRAVPSYTRSSRRYQQFHDINLKFCLERNVPFRSRLFFSSKLKQYSETGERISVHDVQIFLRDKIRRENRRSIMDDDCEQNNTMTVIQILKASKELLETYKAPEPLESVCHLLAFALKNEFRWEDNGFAVLMQMLLLQEENKKTSSSNALCNVQLTNDEFLHYSKMLTRRIQKEPLQYIIGQWDFHSIVLQIRPPCLCPRPETEELVEYAKEDIKRMIRELRSKGIERKLKILDVGCGTGAIGIALAHLFPKDLTVVAIDIAEEAVNLSNTNAENVLFDHHYEKEQNLYQSSFRYRAILSSAVDFSSKVYGTFDMIVSNPPYIPSRDMETLSQDVIEYEDYNALCGGEDGLNVVREICSRLQDWCYDSNEHHSGSFHATCWMELDSSHPGTMSSFLKKEFPHIIVLQSLQDMSGLDRFVQLQVTPTQTEK